MRKHASPLVIAFVAGAVAILGAFAACSSVEGQTPDCVNNIDENGIHPDPNGCNQFASCDKGPPSACCVDDMDMPLMGNDLANCLYSYGGCAAFSVDDMGNATCSDTYDGGGAGGGGGSGGGGSGGGGGGTGGSDGG